jgi:hypothetical protein
LRDEIDRIFLNKIEKMSKDSYLNKYEWEQCNQQHVETVKNGIVMMKTLVLKIPQFSRNIDDAIEKLLNQYEQREGRNSAQFMTSLGIALHHSWIANFGRTYFI